LASGGVTLYSQQQIVRPTLAETMVEEAMEERFVTLNATSSFDDMANELPDEPVKILIEKRLNSAWQPMLADVGIHQKSSCWITMPLLNCFFREDQAVIDL